MYFIAHIKLIYPTRKTDLTLRIISYYSNVRMKSKLKVLNVFQICCQSYLNTYPLCKYTEIYKALTTVLWIRTVDLIIYLTLRDEVHITKDIVVQIIYI